MVVYTTSIKPNPLPPPPCAAVFVPPFTLGHRRGHGSRRNDPRPPIGPPGSSIKAHPYLALTGGSAHRPSPRDHSSLRGAHTIADNRHLSVSSSQSSFVFWVPRSLTSRGSKHLESRPAVFVTLSDHNAGAIIANNMRLAKSLIAVGCATGPVVWPAGVQYANHQDKQPQNSEYR
jgi:hypothetical protein